MSKKDRIYPTYVKGQIYRIDCEINNKVYIGQTKTHLFIGGKWKRYGYLKRWEAHKNCAFSGDDQKRNKSIALYSAIRKYGIENFTISLEEGNIPIGELDDNERWYVAYYESLAPGGYNLESGGNKGKLLSEATKERQSNSKKAFYQSDEGKAWSKKYQSEENPIKTKKTNDKKKIDFIKENPVSTILISKDKKKLIMDCRLKSNGKRKMFRFTDNSNEQYKRLNEVLKTCNLDKKFISCSYLVDEDKINWQDL